MRETNFQKIGINIKNSAKNQNESDNQGLFNIAEIKQDSYLNDLFDVDKLNQINKTNFPKKSINLNYQAKINFFDIDEKEINHIVRKVTTDDSKTIQNNPKENNKFQNYEKFKSSNFSENSDPYHTKNFFARDNHQVFNRTNIQQSNFKKEEQDELDFINEILENESKDDFSIKKVNKNSQYYKNKANENNNNNHHNNLTNFHKNENKSLNNFFQVKKNFNNNFINEATIQLDHKNAYKGMKYKLSNFPENVKNEKVSLPNSFLNNSSNKSINIFPRNISLLNNNQNNQILLNSSKTTDFNLESSFILSHIQSENLSIFPLNRIIKHTSLNKIQSDCFNILFNTDKNCIISAPTGSGKTLLFELAMAKVIKDKYNCSENNFYNKQFKMIYIGPIKSLCQEKFNEWKIKFNLLNLIVVEATGDADYININSLDQANIIVVTPEKFDSLTRKWKKYPLIISSITLILIDEVHLLNEDLRGATLEAVITRIKLLSLLKNFKENKSLLANYRTIAISATIPNINEVAEWLNVDSEGLRIYGEEYRPVKVERLVLGYNMAKNEFIFEKNLNYKLAELISKYSDERPSLIFCQTQKGTVNAGMQLLEDIHKLYLRPFEAETRANLNNVAGLVKDKQLAELIRNGIAFHNAGLSLEDRQIVEENFKKGLIHVICTTSTLAQGVNLPARLVIIKSTFCYRGPKIGYDEYNKMEIDQMVGRAGRPQYDNKGIAIIMTDKQNVDKYSEITCQNYSIKSNLKENLTEHINAEITQGTIVDIETGINWLKNTFMFVRMKNDLINKKGNNSNNIFKSRITSMNNNNKIENQSNNSLSILDKQIEEQLRNLCLKIFKDLGSINLIEISNQNNFNSTSTINTNSNLNKNIESDEKIYKLNVDENDNVSVKINKLGQKMCKNYVLFETMKKIITLQDNSEEAVLDILSNAMEFSKYRSKMEDRKILNNFNKDNSIKYKVKGVIDTYNKKAFLLIQAALSNLPLEPWELRRQQSEIIQSSLRILNCIKQVFKAKDDVKGLAQIQILRKSLSQRLWSNSDLFLKQFPKIGEKIAKNLSRGGINSFDRLVYENPRKIEMLAAKNAPFGSLLIDMAKSIPKLELKYEINPIFNKKSRMGVLNTNNLNQKAFKMTLFVKLHYKKLISQEDFDPYTCFFLMVSNCKNKLISKKKIKPNSNDKEIIFNITNGITDESFPITIFIVCEKFIGLDKSVTIENVNDKNGITSNSLNLTNKTLHDYRNITVNQTTSNNLNNLNNQVNKAPIRFINKSDLSKVSDRNSSINSNIPNLDRSRNNISNNYSNNDISVYSKNTSNNNISRIGNLVEKNVINNIKKTEVKDEFEFDDLEFERLVSQIIMEDEQLENDILNKKLKGEMNIENNNFIKKRENKKQRNNKNKIKDDGKNVDLISLISNMKKSQKPKKTEEAKSKFANHDNLKIVEDFTTQVKNDKINYNNINLTANNFVDSNFNNNNLHLNKNKKIEHLKDFTSNNFVVNNPINYFKTNDISKQFNESTIVTNRNINNSNNEFNSFIDNFGDKTEIERNNFVRNVKKETKFLNNFEDFI